MLKQLLVLVVYMCAIRTLLYIMPIAICLCADNAATVLILGEFIDTIMAGIYMLFVPAYIVTKYKNDVLSDNVFNAVRKDPIIYYLMAFYAMYISIFLSVIVSHSIIEMFI